MIPLRRDPVYLGLLLFTAGLVTWVVRHESPLYYVGWVRLDEGYRLYPPLRLLRGEGALFQGMFTPYPPFSYHLHALAFALLGEKVSSVRALLALSQLVTTGLVYALARRAMRRGFALYAALFSLVYGVVQLNMGYSGWYVVPLGLGAALCVCRFAEAREPALRALFAAGLLAGLAVGTKHRDGTWVLAACATAVLASRLLRDVPGGGGRFHPLYAAHALVPLAALLLLRGALDANRALLLLLPLVALSTALLLRQLRAASDSRARPAELLRELATLGLGAAVVNAPWLLHHAAQAGFGAVWRQLVAIPMAMQGRLVHWAPVEPMTAAWALSGGVLLLAAALLFGPRPRPRALERGLPLLLLAGFTAPPLLAYGLPSLLRTGRFALLPLSSLLGLLWLARPPTRRSAAEAESPDAAGPGPARVAFGVAVIFGCVVPLGLFPATDFPHWLWACPFAFVVSAGLADHALAALERRRARFVPLAWAALAALLWVQLPAALDPTRGRPPRVALRGSAAADIRVDPRSARQIQPVLDFVANHVPEEGSILEIPSGFFAFLSQRRQAAGLDYFYTLDGALWPELEELQRIRARAPRYAIVPAGDPGWPAWRASFPALSWYLAEAYVRVARVGEVAILVRRGAGEADGAAAPRRSPRDTLPEPP